VFAAEEDKQRRRALEAVALHNKALRDVRAEELNSNNEV
jgi:hypothetical protein